MRGFWQNHGMVQPAAAPVLSCAEVRRWEAGLLKNHDHEQEWAAMQATCRGVVWPGRAADLLARPHGQVAIEASQPLEQLGPALTQLHD